MSKHIIKRRASVDYIGSRLHVAEYGPGYACVGMWTGRTVSRQAEAVGIGEVRREPSAWDTWIADSGDGVSEFPRFWMALRWLARSAAAM